MIEKTVSIWSIQQYDHLESTNQTMMQMFENNEHLHHFVITANQQIKGKGRLGHHWVSPIGNSYSTYLLNFQEDDFFIKDDNLSLLGFATALAIVKTLIWFGVSEDDIFCKWPNDILVRGKKISGILLEGITSSDNKLRAVIVGCGVNLNHAPKGEGIDAMALSDLIDCDIKPDRYLQQYLLHLKEIITSWKQEGKGEIIKAWSSYSHKAGSKIRVRLPHETFYAIFDHFDMQGHLIVKLDNGDFRTIFAGDVFALT